MKRCYLLILTLVPCLGVLRPAAQAQAVVGNVLVPDTSIEQPGDRGLRAHTNHVVLLGASSRATPAGRSGATGGGSGPSGSMLPKDLRAAYQLPSTGGSGVIAIVDAYDHPNALSDFNTFSTNYGLPVEKSTNATAASNTVFQVVYQGTSKPRRNTGWAQEEALDIEWAHAMAPGAKIILYECQSNSFSNLFGGVQSAANLPGVTQVSMSWSGGEFSTEAQNDGTFTKSGVVFLAASGDTGGGVQYPACSPNVIAVGGTSLSMSGTTFLGETGWSGSGGGNSKYEAKPGYQSGIAGTGSNRSVPDVAADADPNTGVLVVYNGGLYIFGGTSVACPCWAGIVNLAGGKASSSAVELGVVYNQYTNNAEYRDILTGTAGTFGCHSGWDFVTGCGSPLTTVGK